MIIGCFNGPSITEVLTWAAGYVLAPGLRLWLFERIQIGSGFDVSGCNTSTSVQFGAEKGGIRYESWVEIPGCFWHVLTLEMGKVLWMGIFSDGVNAGQWTGMSFLGTVGRSTVLHEKNRGWAWLAHVGTLTRGRSPSGTCPMPTRSYSLSFHILDVSNGKVRTLEDHRTPFEFCITLS